MELCRYARPNSGVAQSSLLVHLLDRENKARTITKGKKRPASFAPYEPIERLEKRCVPDPPVGCHPSLLLLDQPSFAHGA
jgi:hypothetical protein